MNTKTRNYGIAAIAVLSVVLIIGSGFVFHEDSDIRFDAHQSADGNLNYIHYWGDYDYDAYMEEGSTSLDSLYSFLADKVTDGKIINGVYPKNCSTFVTLKEDGTGYYAGRNFDFRYCTPMVVFTEPSNRYASVTTVDSRMFGNTDESFEDIQKDSRFNAVPYLPMDGMNEKGVYVCINSVSKGAGFIQTEEGKSTLFITSSIRLIMDYADSTESALRLLDRFNIFSDVDYHLLICDNTGYSVSVEFVGPNKYVNETKLMTNHYIAEEGGSLPVKPSSAERFNILKNAMAEKSRMTESDVRNAMKAVMQNDPDQTHYTRWSVVYDLEDLDASICFRINNEMCWDTPYYYDVHGTHAPSTDRICSYCEIVATVRVEA